MSTRSLTQTEAERRSALLAVQRYDVEVDLTDLPTGPAVRCTSTITFNCREPGADSFVDCAADVVSATLNGVTLAVSEQDVADGRIMLPDLAERNVLHVESVQTNTTDGEGVHKAIDPADAEVYLWMCFAPDEGRFVWACFDQPDLKAAHAITVTAPEPWTVLTNSGAPRVDELDKARRWSFPDTPPLSVYNLVINAGPLHEIRRESGGYDLGIFARRSLAAVLERDADEIFTLTTQGLDFFARVFKMPFPQRKYDQAFMPDFGGAMENYGCVTWSDSFLRRTPPTPAERDLLARYLLHELAHMWFGNIVTMRWWDDLWLNEAFAEFASNWAAVSATSYQDAWAKHLAAEKIRAYLADQGPTTHPIRTPIRDVAEAASIFDAITYPKGASVLQQLMTYVGEEEFCAGMSAYFAQHAWGNTTLQDLIDALAATSGRDLDAWRAGWLEVAGTDRLTLEQGDEVLTLVATGPQGPPRPQVLAVGAYTRGRGGFERTALARVEVDGARTPVDLPSGADVYLVNDDDLTFATTRPDAATRDALFESASQLPTAISRGVAIATVWDMLASGEAAAREVVECLNSVLTVETAASVVEPYLALAAGAAESWSPEVDRVALEAMVAQTCRDLAAVASRTRVALRTFARTAPDGDALAWVRSQAGDDIDLLWRVLVREAQLGSDTAAEVERLSRDDADPEVWVRALTVRAAMPDADAKAEVWQTLAIDRAVPIGSVGGVAAAFWRPGQDDLLFPYAQRYLGLVPDLDKGGMLPAMTLTAVLFPIVGADAAFLDAAEAAAEQAAPVVRKTLLGRADTLRRMLRSRNWVGGIDFGRH